MEIIFGAKRLDQVSQYIIACTTTHIAERDTKHFENALNVLTNLTQD